MDLDNKWSYMKTHGDTGWKDFPSYFNTLIPYVLELLDDLNLKITFFIVGQDAALKKNNDSLKLITERGHEVGNHSFHHEPWFRQYSKERIKWEILKAERHIVRVTGEKPIGFRGPGFSWSSCLFEALAENEYVYDSSTLPTFIGPLARAYYFWSSNLTFEAKNQHKELFGSLKNGMKPVKSYLIRTNLESRLLEVPVTTIPLLKTPFHLSYLLYISRFSEILMNVYYKTALNLCKMTHTEPSFLLHPLDFLGGGQVPELKFFPGMDLNRMQKLIVIKKVLTELKKHYALVKMSTHAQSLLNKKNLRILSF